MWNVGNSELSAFPLDSFTLLKTELSLSEVIESFLKLEKEKYDCSNTHSAWEWVRTNTDKSANGASAYRETGSVQEGSCTHPWKCIPLFLFAVQGMDPLVMSLYPSQEGCQCKRGLSIWQTSFAPNRHSPSTLLTMLCLHERQKIFHGPECQMSCLFASYSKE